MLRHRWRHHLSTDAQFRRAVHSGFAVYTHLTCPGFSGVPFPKILGELPHPSAFPTAQL